MMLQLLHPTTIYRQQCYPQSTKWCHYKYKIPKYSGEGHSSLCKLHFPVGREHPSPQPTSRRLRQSCAIISVEIIVRLSSALQKYIDDHNLLHLISISNSMGLFRNCDKLKFANVVNVWTEKQKYRKPSTCTCSCSTIYCCWPESKRHLAR